MLVDGEEVMCQQYCVLLPVANLHGSLQANPHNNAALTPSLKDPLTQLSLNLTHLKV